MSDRLAELDRLEKLMWSLWWRRRRHPVYLYCILRIIETRSKLLLCFTDEDDGVTE